MWDRVKYACKFAADFETSVYEGQTETEVWASALVELLSETPKIFTSIDETFDYLCGLRGNSVLYYHNLKFDGTFWLNFLLKKMNYQQAYKQGETVLDYEFLKDGDMPDGSFKYLISSQGSWYYIVIRTRGGKYIQILDSYKLLPFSIKKIGKDFKTKHQKTEIEYVGERHAGGVITDEEREYIANDVLVLREALNVMFKEKHEKMTIGSCCLQEFKKGYRKEDYETLFPDLTDWKYHEQTLDEYVRKSYNGGWCYVVPEKAGKVLSDGVTADVNSLYPSMMHSQSGNRYPVGLPKFWEGDIPEEATKNNRYYFVHFKTRFYIKTGYLPFVHVKTGFLYSRNECLTSSDVYYNGKYWRFLRDDEGNDQPTTVELTMTCTDWILFNEHYNLEDLEIIDGCYFETRVGIFDKYIDKYKKIKMTSKGAIRQIAKLFLNNLYGKLASSTASDFKVCYIKDNGGLGFFPVFANDKKPGYIPVGSAITSYARNFTIRAAQKNYHGPNAPGFVYADTDSIHCDTDAESLTGINIDPVDFCCWALECKWDRGYFVRQKTYIEHIVESDGEACKPHYNIKCAGMPETSKKYFEFSMRGVKLSKNDDGTAKILNWQDLTTDEIKLISKASEEVQDFIAVKRELTDFQEGITVPGKLLPKQIAGGTVLQETAYTMRGLWRC